MTKPKTKKTNGLIAFYPEYDDNCPYCWGRGIIYTENCVHPCQCGKLPIEVEELRKKNHDQT